MRQEGNLPVNGLAKGLEKINRVLTQGVLAIMVCLLVLMVSVIFLQVFSRYVLHNAFGWTDELTLMMMTWLTFLGGFVVARKGQWVSIDVLVLYLPDRIRRHLGLLIEMAALLFTVTIVVQGVKLAYLQKEMVTPALEISLAWVYLSVPVGSLLLVLHQMQTTWQRLKDHPSLWITVLVATVCLAPLLAVLPSIQSSINFPLFVFVVMMLLFLMGMPVAIALGITAMVFFLAKGDMLFVTIPQKMTSGVNAFAFMALPFFVLAGELMERGGVTIRLVNFATTLVGHIRGGLAHVAVVSNLIMAGMSGSELADAAATGSVLIPSMTRKGYPPGFSAGVIAAASVIGPIFPPSVPFIIFAALSGASVLKLFLGGAIPGLLMALFLMGACFLTAKRLNLPREPRASLRFVFSSFTNSILALLMPLIIVGGMLGGIFTPTEAADIAVIYALIIGLFFYRELSGPKILEGLAKVAVMVSGIMYIMATASIIGWIAAREQIPQALTGLLLTFGDSPWMVLLAINVMLLVLGCFISATAIQLIMIPILVPIAQTFHFDLVHFGVMFSLNVMMGGNTPPFGAAMFIVCKIAGVSIANFVKYWWPFGIALLLVLALITYVPSLVLWLPNLLLK
jgi:tripartite ATP-independent transporter DctM subunit